MHVKQQGSLDLEVLSGLGQISMLGGLGKRKEHERACPFSKNHGSGQVGWVDGRVGTITFFGVICFGGFKYQYHPFFVNLKW